MALAGKTNFKTDIVTGTSGDRQGTLGHATIHNQVGSVLNNLQDDVGIDSSADTASLKYKTANVDNLKAKSVETPSVDGQFLKYNSSTDDLTWTTPAGGGDVVGPSSATDDNIVTFDSTSGKLIKDSGVDASGISANTTHRSSDGTDHANVVLNDTHRSSNGGDHSFLDQSVISGATPTFTNTNFTEATDKNYVTDAEAIVIGNTSNTNTGDEASASVTVSGVSELATTAEIDTGTDATRTMPVDQFVASSRNVRYITWRVLDSSISQVVSTTVGGDFEIPFTGTIISIGAYDDTVGTTGTATYDVHLGGTTIMTTNKISIETGEKSSRDAGTQPSLTTTATTVGDIFTVDIDAIQSGTAAKGLVVRMGVRLT